MNTITDCINFWYGRPKLLYDAYIVPPFPLVSALDTGHAEQNYKSFKDWKK